MLEIKSNAKHVRKQLENETRALVKAMQKSMQKWGNATIRYAKKDKGYKRQSGNLDTSQKAKVDGLTVTISIDPDIVMAPRTVKGKTVTPKINYGIIQHNKYPWLYNAVDDKEDELEKQLLDDIGRILG